MIERTLHEPTLTVPVASLVATTPDVPHWHISLPRLNGRLVTLREFRLDDAPALLAAVGSEQVSRSISPPPATIPGMEAFIAWTHAQRETGRSATFAVQARGIDTVIGLFQVRSLDAGFDNAEWGFALSSEFWGTGAFSDAARLVLDFAFNVIGVRRLEARAVMRNGRGNGALYKLGAVQEAVLRRSFLKNGEYFDQALWILERDGHGNRRETDPAALTIH
jgi:[ribosomal protein S5]-alanine N-acetyltransferase